jgi:hypothetical protein
MVRAWLIIILLALPKLAHAEPAQDAMLNYFEGEKTGGYVLAGMGTAALAAGGLMIRSSDLRLKGASYTFLGVGGLHLAAAIYVWLASDSRIDKFTDEIAQDRAAWLGRERTRMAGVSTQLTTLKIAELVIAAGGLTLAGIGHQTDRPRLMGAGLALSLEMAATFTFDVFAARRAQTYRDGLAAIEPMARLAPDAPSFVLSWSQAW